MPFPHHAPRAHYRGRQPAPRLWPSPWPSPYVPFYAGFAPSAYAIPPQAPVALQAPDVGQPCPEGQARSFDPPYACAPISSERRALGVALAVGGVAVLAVLFVGGLVLGATAARGGL